MATSNDLAGQLIGRCFAVRDNAHILHLRTTSYSQHMALNQLYDEIIPLVDSFAEVYQGDFGRVNVQIPTGIPNDTGLNLINDLTMWIDKNRDSIGDSSSSHIQNIIDEIVALLSEVRYKLRFLD